MLYIFDAFAVSFFRMAVDTSYIVAAQHKDSSEVYFSVSVCCTKCLTK